MMQDYGIDQGDQGIVRDADGQEVFKVTACNLEMGLVCQWANTGIPGLKGIPTNHDRMNVAPHEPRPLLHPKTKLPFVVVRQYKAPLTFEPFDIPG